MSLSSVGYNSVDKDLPEDIVLLRHRPVDAVSPLKLHTVPKHGTHTFSRTQESGWCASALLAGSPAVLLV